MNILFLTPAPPDEPRDGARLIVHHLARVLCAQHTLYLCSLIAPEENRARAEAQLRVWFAKARLVPLPARPRAAKWSANFVDDAPLWVRAYDVPTLRAALREMLARHAIDVVHCDTGLMAQYADALDHLPRLIAPHDCLTHALEFQARAAPHPLHRFAARLQISKMQRYETRAYARFARAVMVTPQERAALCAFAPTLDVAVIPSGVDTNFFAPLPIAPVPHSLGFLGVMEYVPNQVAALYFVREILPRIRRALPEATFTIIGRNPPPRIRRLANEPYTRVTGTVDDVRPFVAAQGVMVCPMHDGGGIKNKVLEALAMGKPVVATPDAVAGLDLQPDQDFLMARDAGDFADACVQLLCDEGKRARLAQRARAWTLEHSWTRAAEQYLDAYRHVTGSEKS